MAKVILGVTISLDGFAEDSEGSVGALYPDLDQLRNTDLLQKSIRNTGSVVMAWKEFAMAEDPDWFAGNYEYQVPIFVFTDRVPEKHPKETDRLTFTFVTDGIASAVRQAKVAAAQKDVTIIGSAATVPQVLNAGLADELEIDIFPMFLHNGFRPFERVDEHIRLKKAKIVEAGERTSLQFRVERQESKGGEIPMTKLNTYLNFAGNTEEAFKFYRSIFGGEFTSVVRFKDMPMEGVKIPKQDQNKIMHIGLPVGKDDVLMGTDSLESLGMKLVQGNNVYLSVHPDTKVEADRLFKALSAGGTVEMPIADQAWGDYYGSFKDKFGVLWMVDYAYPKAK